VSSKIKLGDLLLFRGKKVYVESINPDSNYPYTLSLASNGKCFGEKGAGWNLDDENFEILTKGHSMFSQVKEYFQKNRDVVFTLILCILIDRFVFDGAFTAKIKATVDKLLDDAGKRVGK
jgi:hypothetical protein